MDSTEIAKTLRSLPTVLEVLLGPIDPTTLRSRPEENEWCPLEVIGHLIACDSSAFRDRITGIVDGNPDIAGFDPWEAINARDFAAESLDSVLKELTQERSASYDLIMSLGPADLAKTALFEDGRRFAASDFVHEWPFHDQDHGQQILASLKLAYLPGMTPVMRDALAAG
jgi:hypothetical protein